MSCQTKVCEESSVDVWIMWLFITCGIIFCVSLTLGLIRHCMARKKHPHPHHHPRQPPPIQRGIAAPVYYVTNVPAQRQVVTPHWNIVQMQEYPQPPPNYNQILGQGAAPPAYNVTYPYANNTGPVQTTVVL